jgi:hypothetical protein
MPPRVGSRKPSHEIDSAVGTTGGAASPTGRGGEARGKSCPGIHRGVPTPADSRVLDGVHALAVLLLLTGCIETIAEHDAPTGEVARDCVVPPPAGITALGPPVSLEYPDASLWFWEDLARADGTPLPGPAAWVTSVDAACAAGPALVADDAGAPAQVLALAPDEILENETRTDGRRLALAPTGGFVLDGTGYLFYDLVVRGPGFFDEELLGTGMCTLAPGARTCERVARPDGTTLLWTPLERVLNRGGLVAGSPARALVAGCRRVGSFSTPCTIAGALVADVRDPDAYQMFEQFTGWVDALTDATIVGDAAGAFTIAPYDDGFAAIALDIFTGTVWIRVARAATGEFGHASETFTAVAPVTWPVHGGREHIALRPRPRSIVISYTTDGAPAGLHLVAYLLEPSLEDLE